MPLYTKTALKKIKKDELVQMFLDLQAQKVDHMMDEVVEKCCTNAIEEVVEDLKEENEKLKEQAEDAFQAIAEALCGEGEEADSIAGWGQERQIIGRINLMKKEVANQNQ
jgi:predicted transcriptional regulator